ncbi:MAG: hypothetical protein MUF60_11540 [Vicinamibacterales bacterium]|jgi:hypothetical protein|nr:hypothetical protein [Vicinamibacterales bacterium]
MRAVIPLVVATVLAASSALAQPSRSAEAAAALTALLDERGITTFVAADPAEAGRFVAVMYVPKSQLLVVGARYPVPALMQQRLERAEFQEGYMDLQCACVVESKWFVQDLQADGLRATRVADEPFDLVYRGGKNFVVLDGNWAGQSLGEDEYVRRYALADDCYTRMLLLLAGAVRAGS